MRGTTILLLILAAGAAVALLGLVGSAVLRLAAPGALWLLVVPFGIVASWLVWWYWRGLVMQRLGTPQAVARLATATSTRLRVARMLLTAAAACCFVFGAARPQWGEQPLEVTRAGIDVVFAIDLSRSMLATDLAPSRLEAVRAELDRLMRRLDGDRVGLVVFAADAVRQSPLTSDYGAIRHYLRRAHPDHFSRQGTAIGRAIAEAQRLLVGEEGSPFRRASTQVIVVVSDGEDTISDPLAAAAAAQEAGIRVFTVGMGTAEGARIPIRDADGALRGYLRDRAGNEVITRLVEDQLDAIAQSGGGDYRRYTSEGSIATWLETSIAAFDREALSSALRVQYADRFLWFVLPGLLLLLLASSLPEVPRPRRATMAAALLVALVGAGCDLDLQRADPRVEAAMDHWRNQEAAQAREVLETVGEAARALPAFAYNEALVLEALQDLEGAQRRYLTALGLESSWAQARALFGLGNALMARDQLVEAISRYQRALALDPELEEARRNLQIALQRLYPACATLDDDAEPNDVAANAQDLPHAVYQGTFVPPNAPAPLEGQTDDPSWVLCGGNDDLHALPLMGGSIVTVRVDFSRLRDDTGGAPLPDQIPPQAVRIALRAYDGTTTLAVDQGLVDADGNPVAEVSATSVQRAVVQYEVDALQPPDAMGFLLVQADPGLEYRYTVEVEVEPPCYALEDAYESNDLARTATPTDEDYAPRQARLCPGNADWYRMDLPANHDAFVDVTSLVRDDQTPGALVVDFFVDDITTPVESRTVDPTLPETTFRVMPTDTARTLYWRVTSPTEADEGQYTLTLYRYPPCPDGNDRFEPNDAANTRRTIGDDQNPLPLRHLRICEGDNDWFEVALPAPPSDEDEDPEAAKAPRPFSILVRTEDPSIDIRAAAWDAANGELLLVTEPIVAADGAAPAGPSTTPPPTPDAAPTPPDAAPTPSDATAPLAGSAGAALLDATVSAIVVQVTGQPGFYDLELPDTQQQQEQQQQQQQQQDEQDGEPSEDDAQDEAPEDGDPQDEQENEQEQDPSQEDESSTSPEDQQREEEQSEEEQAEAEAAEERARLLELLDSLEQDDLNLQMRQALDNLPAVEVEQPW